MFLIEIYKNINKPCYLHLVEIIDQFRLRPIANKNCCYKICYKCYKKCYKIRIPVHHQLIFFDAIPRNIQLPNLEEQQRRSDFTWMIYMIHFTFFNHQNIKTSFVFAIKIFSRASDYLYKRNVRSSVWKLRRMKHAKMSLIFNSIWLSTKNFDYFDW